ncbi:MAG: methylmalonyl Co-A mutase-associated GTPase MeaB [bacterium]|nr:methylmalonyl Co-A mutase-associated GTPase MeaB [bacterium]
MTVEPPGKPPPEHPTPPAPNPAGSATGDVGALFARARDGDRRALGRLLTYTEGGGPLADAVAVAAWPLAGQAHVVGMTGAPGVGKSTLTDRLAQVAADDGRRVAILAVDPSSPLTGGAILGDRVRMGSAAAPGGPFVRSMASRGQSGGLALAALAAVRLLDATGHDLIIVETVGIGQVEVDIARTADTTIVAVSPGWGDAVQANKAGLLEMADVFVVNKADRTGAADARRDLEHMLDLGHRAGWRPPVALTVATTGEGADELFKHVQDHRHHLRTSSAGAERRARHVAEEVRRHLHRWVDLLVEQPSRQAEELFADVAQGELAPSAAARQLVGELGGADGGDDGAGAETGG